MRATTVLAACLLLALGSPQAYASAFSDFNAGIAARNGDRCDIAIARETAALNAPDLLASLKPVALLVRAECNSTIGHGDVAIADFDAALAIKPDDIEIHMMRGAALADLKRYDAAAADFQTIIRLRSDLTRGYLLLGGLYIQQHQVDAAIAQYTALIAAQPMYAVGYILRSRMFLLKGDTDDAMSDANRILSMAPHEATGYTARSLVYLVKGDFDHALSDIDDSLDYRHNDVDLTLQKGILEWDLGKFSDAVETLEPLAKTAAADGYAVIWLDLARVAENGTDRDLAARAARIDRANWPGPLVTLYMGQSSPDAVIADLAKASEDDRERNTCETEFYAGEWQLRHQARDAGIGLLQKVLNDCPVTYVEHSAAAVELGRLK